MPTPSKVTWSTCWSKFWNYRINHFCVEKPIGNTKTTKTPRVWGDVRYLHSVPTTQTATKGNHQRKHLEVEYGNGFWSSLTQLNQWYSVLSNPFESGFSSLGWRWRWFKSLLPDNLGWFPKRFVRDRWDSSYVSASAPLLKKKQPKRHMAEIPQNKFVYNSYWWFSQMPSCSSCVSELAI